MFNEIIKLIESMDGLEVSYKIGKESELVIKGDFITMAKAAANLANIDSKNADAKIEIEHLKNEIKRLEGKIEA